MTVFMTILAALVLALLILVAGFAPRRSRISVYELERRGNANDKAAQEELYRERLLGDILSLQRVLTALLQVIFVACAVAAFGWLSGILLSLVVALEYGALARLSVLQRWSQQLYEQYENVWLDFVKKYRGLFRFLRHVSSETPTAQVGSREELHHLIEQSGSLLSPGEKKLFTYGLKFEGRQVREVMTPRSVIDSISKKELLGPLVLDDLHKTGHSRFPVVEGDIDHVVGMLHIQDLFTLDKKRSVMVEKAMEPRVYYIREDQTLGLALAAFLRTHHHLFVVVNEFRETVGLLSLEDVMEALLGRKIVDEFDAHDDLRAVAEQNPRGNNHPKKREDV